MAPGLNVADNGLAYRRGSPGRRPGGRNGLEHELRRLGVNEERQTESPQTQGKAERFQQTLKKWLAPRSRPDNLAQLQALLDIFIRSTTTAAAPIPAAPAPPPPPMTPGPRPPRPARHRQPRPVRADRVDADGKLTLRYAGRLYHIGIGRTHARTRVLMLVRDLHIRVINAATGELLRELTLDPDRDYQATGGPPGPPPGTGRKIRNPRP